MGASFPLKRSERIRNKGVYRFIVEKAESSEGSAGPNVKLQLRPLFGNTKGLDTIYENLSTSGSSRFRVEQFFDAVNAPDDPEQKVGDRWFEGKVVWASVKQEEWQGNINFKVNQYLTPEAAEKLIEKQTLSAGSSEAVEVATERSTRPVNPPKSARKSAAALPADAADDEDVPF